MQIPSTRPLPAARSDRAECVPCPPLGDMLLWTALLFLGPVLGTPGLPKAVVDLEPPWILVLREDNVTLKCQGAHTAGDHSIRWFHNGSSIPTQVRPNYSFKATEKDRGEYACQTDQTSLSDPVYLDVFSAWGLLSTPPPRPTLSPAGSDRPGGKALRTGRALTCVSLSLQEGKEVRQSPSTKPPQPLPPPSASAASHWSREGLCAPSLRGFQKIAEDFRSQIDRKALGLPEEHMGAANMKLGPALKICPKTHVLKETSGGPLATQPEADTPQYSGPNLVRAQTLQGRKGQSPRQGRDVQESVAGATWQQLWLFLWALLYYYYFFKFIYFEGEREKQST
uniref:low affinity immunoglobulin gamma Fc region receptor II-b isoform X1 n=1 Tax=Panthera onca TaxID=9690 RepID=UPI002952B213|nr:low affinity immunoglobulin gamma Fc region receptor II-b isoform X1 [Panthera onca]